MASTTFRDGADIYVPDELIRYNGELVRKWELRRHPWDDARGDYDPTSTATVCNFTAPARATRAQIIAAAAYDDYYS